MRSRKPETRATIFTWRELSVCATNTGVYGIDVGSTVSTLTSGAGRGGGGASLLHAHTSATSNAAAIPRERMGSDIVLGKKRTRSDCTRAGKYCRALFAACSEIVRVGAC